MPMMNIRRMIMLVLDRLMNVLVDVFIDVFTGMRVDVVVISQVTMGVHDPFVEMPVDVPLADKKNHSCQKEHECDEEAGAGELAEDEKGCDGPDERGNGEIGPRPGGAEVPERQDEEDDA